MSLNSIETAEFVFELTDEQYTRAVDFIGCMAQPIGKNDFCDEKPVPPTPAPVEVGKGHMCCSLPAYIGTKVIGAEEMCDYDFHIKFKGNKPAWEGTIHDIKEGYHVQHLNPDGTVYDSWSPKDVFKMAYRKVDDGITFGDAVYFLKKERKVARKGWNGKGMWLELVPSNAWARLFGNTTDYKNCDFIAMKTADNKYVPWLASQTDVLADDWMVIE